MGRRAQRKIPSDLDLSKYLFDLERLPRPFDSAGLFGQTGPLEVEVGSGKGLFLSNASAARPNHHFVGIEKAPRYARFAAARLAKRQCDNTIVIQGDGQQFFRDYLSKASVSVVHVYFPDPWWKKRHKKRRVLKLSFLKDVERVLIPGGYLSFWTDVQEYFETTLELLARSTNLGPPKSVDETPAEHDLDYRTHFERRTRLHDESVYRAEFYKSAVELKNTTYGS